MKNFVARELAMIASIDGGLSKETNPELVILLHAMKEGHQDAHAQVAALARAEHRAPQRGWPMASMVMQLEGWIARAYGAGFNLDVLRALEARFETAYTEAREHANGLARDVFDLLARRAAQRWQVLDHRGARTCMRCLLDRGGTHPPLLRDRPRIYVCSACHDEVRTTFPPDIAAQLDRWPPQVRAARIIQRALSRPSKQRARDEVHTALAGQPPITRHEAVRRVEEPSVITSPVQRSSTTLVVPRADGEYEQQYTEMLFDYRSIRARW
jgi:hypothetical protein